MPQLFKNKIQAEFAVFILKNTHKEIRLCHSGCSITQLPVVEITDSKLNEFWEYRLNAGIVSHTQGKFGTVLCLLITSRGVNPDHSELVIVSQYTRRLVRSSTIVRGGENCHQPTLLLYLVRKTIKQMTISILESHQFDRKKTHICT